MTGTDSDPDNLRRDVNSADESAIAYHTDAPMPTQPNGCPKMMFAAIVAPIPSHNRNQARNGAPWFSLAAFSTTSVIARISPSIDNGSSTGVEGALAVGLADPPDVAERLNSAEHGHGDHREYRSGTKVNHSGHVTQHT